MSLFKIIFDFETHFLTIYCVAQRLNKGSSKIVPCARLDVFLVHGMMDYVYASKI